MGVMVPILLSILSTPTFAVSSNQHFQAVNPDSGSAFASWPVTVGQFSNPAVAVGPSLSSAPGAVDITFVVDTPQFKQVPTTLTTTANVFQISPGLNSATLSPVTLNVCVSFDVQTHVCIQAAPVTIQASWTGSGSPSTSVTNSIAKGSPPFPLHSMLHGVTTVRPGTVTGSLNGQQLGQSSSAQLLKSSGHLIFQHFPTN